MKKAIDILRKLKDQILLDKRKILMLNEENKTLKQKSADELKELVMGILDVIDGLIKKRDHYTEKYPENKDIQMVIKRFARTSQKLLDVLEKHKVYRIEIPRTPDEDFIQRYCKIEEVKDEAGKFLSIEEEGYEIKGHPFISDQILRPVSVSLSSDFVK